MNNSDSVAKPAEMSDERWIPVEQELPALGRTVIVEGGIAYRSEDGWVTQTGAASGRPIVWHVTHWQPLPELSPRLPRTVQPAPIEHGKKRIVADAIVKRLSEVYADRLLTPITVAEEVTLPVLDVTDPESIVAELEWKSIPQRLAQAKLYSAIGHRICRERQLLSAITEIAALKAILEEQRTAVTEA